jgi:HEAT repeat-containing protein 5
VQQQRAPIKKSSSRLVIFSLTRLYVSRQLELKYVTPRTSCHWPIHAFHQLLTVLYREPDPSRSVADIENVVQLCVKSLDVIDRPTRTAFAQCVGTILASSQVQRAAPPPETNKKGKGKGREVEVDDIIDPPPPIATDAPRMIMSIPDMLGVLASHFNKISASRKTRLGLFNFYSVLFVSLGPSFVESNYAIIVTHLMDSVVSYPYPRSLGTRHDKLLVRHGVSILLRDLIATRMLSESGHIGAVRELSTTYLRKWPALLPGDKAPTKEVLVVSLREVSGLVAQMGNAPPPVQVRLVRPPTSLKLNLPFRMHCSNLSCNYLLTPRTL